MIVPPQASVCFELAKQAETDEYGRQCNQQPAYDIDFEPLVLGRGSAG
jgi:hypothetical protein